jgi:hypothetical protein
MSVNEVAINTAQTDLLSPRGVMLRPPLSVCWRMQTLEIDPSSREIGKVSGLLGIHPDRMLAASIVFYVGFGHHHCHHGLEPLEGGATVLTMSICLILRTGSSVG